MIPPSAWSDHAPTCNHCADWVKGYATAWADAQATMPTCQHTHPAIADSVARMFQGWDGAQAALKRSVTRFRTERATPNRRGDRAA